MDKRDNAFEKFINDLLRTHDGNDKLRQVLSGSESLNDTVDKLLLESHLEAFFIPVEDISPDTYEDTMLRLNKLKHRIQNTVNTLDKVVKPELTKCRDTDLDMVNLIITKFQDRKCDLSTEILLYLNDLYKKYK